MNRFQEPVQSIDVTLTPLHPDHTYFPLGQAGALHFWYKRGRNPIKGFKISPEANGAPGGAYEKVRINIDEPEQPAVILWCKRGGNDSPIVDVQVGPASPGEGFERSEDPVLGDAYLWSKTQQASRQLREEDKMFFVGARFDIKDGKTWRPAQVIEVLPETIRVSYEGWSSKWDETLLKSAPRILPLWYVTNGQWGGPGKTLRPAFQLSRDIEAFQEHLGTVEALQRKWAAGNALRESELEYLLRGQGQWYFRWALHSSLEKDTWAEHAALVQRYIRAVLGLVLLVLQRSERQVDPNWINVLSLALGGDRRNWGYFYEEYGLGAPLGVAGEWAEVSPAAPTYLAENINFFGSNGGFEEFRRLLAPSTKAAFTVTVSILQCLQSIGAGLAPAFIDRYLQQLDVPAVLRGIIGNLTEEELRLYEHQVILQKIRNIAVGLLPGAREDPRRLDLFMEECDLELLDVVITLGVFKQKMQAMTHLGRIIEAVIPPEAKRYLSGHQQAELQQRGSYQQVRDQYGRIRQQWVPEPPPPPPVKYLSADAVGDWILQRQIVERMFGKDSHEQLVRKTAQVLKFLAQQRRIRASHLEQLWNVHAGAGESTIRVLQDTVADLAQELSRAHLDFLFERIRQKPLAKYRDYDLVFVKQFTISAIRALARQPAAQEEGSAASANADADADEIEAGLGNLRLAAGEAAGPENGGDNFYGLDIFWRVILDESLGGELRLQAFGFLRELLHKEALAAQRGIYAEKCLDLLKANLAMADPAERPASAVYVLKLVREIVAAVADPRLVAQAIEELDRRSGLLGLVLRNTQRYAAWAKSAGAGGAPGHDDEMSTGLNLVTECVEYSNLTLHNEHAELLWSAFVENAAVPADTALLLDYLTQSVPKAAAVFNPETVELIFGKLAAGDVTARRDDGAGAPVVTEAWYQCFERFFLLANTSNGALASAHLRTLYTLDHALLQGEDPLWRFACEAVDPGVSERARALLVLIYSRLNLEREADQLKAILRRFLERGMGLLAAAAAEMGPHNELAEVRQLLVGQTVQLLEAFLQRVGSAAESPVVRPLFKAGERVKAWWLTNKKNIQYDAQVEAVNPDGTYRVLYADNDRDSKCPEFNLFNADGSRRVGPVLDPSIPRYPQEQLAASNEWFGLFFKLLGLGGATAQQVWSLLSGLPTNQDLLVRMGDLGATPAEQPIAWNELLPSDSFIKLLYTLRIVRGLINLPEAPQPDSDDDDIDDDAAMAGAAAAGLELTEAQVAWRRMFFARGGFAHLYQAFLQMPDESILSGVLPKQSVVCILQILQHFLVDPAEATRIPAEVARAGVDFRQLAHRLLACLHATSLGRIPAEAPEQETLAHAELLRQLGISVCALFEAQADPAEQAALAACVYEFPGWGGLVYHGLLKSQHQGIMQELRRQITANIWSKLRSVDLAAAAGAGGGDADEQKGAEAGGPGSEPEDRPVVGAQSKMHCFAVPLLLGQLLEIDPNSADLDFIGFLDCVRLLLEPYRITAETMDVWPVAQRLTELIQRQAFEEDSNVTDFTLVGLLNLASLLVQALGGADRHVFGIGGGCEGGGGLEDDPALRNAIEAVGGAAPLDPANTSRGGTGLVVDLLRYLFDIPRNSSSSTQQDLPPKFKSKTTRTAAFNLLRLVAKGSPRDSLVICRGLMPNHLVTADNDTFNRAWDYEFREYEVKRRGAYVGLRNLGCICYMNSSLQQLFMVPEIRRGVLAIDEYKRDGDGEASERTSLVYQLQHLFANLQESTETYVSPKSLTDIWIGDDGRPINVAKQEDSADFVNTLIDRVSDRLKGTKYEHAFSSIIKGQIADQIIGRGGCPHYREHQQPFNVLPVEIKGKKTLQEALDGFVQGELMAGDNKVNCEQCGSKQAVFKRQVLKHLPQVFCVNLKRFALDYETFETVKINARLEFPIELDMRPYTIENLPIPEDSVAGEAAAAGGADEGKAADEPAAAASSEAEAQAAKHAVQPDEYYQYVLRGVVVHTGDVNRGHYYSYIQERTADPAKPGRWYCFNDHSVKPFDPRNLEACAFGGENTAHGHANAYLLFYDRKCSPERLAELQREQQQRQQQGEAEDEADSPRSQLRQADGDDSDYALVDPDGREEKQEACEIAEPAAGTAAVPREIFQKIWQQNITSARDKLVYDPDYFEFLAVLLQQIADDFPAVDGVHPRPVDLSTADLSVPADLRDAACRLAVRFMIKSLARCTHKSQLNPLGRAMVSLIERNVTASAWLMWMMVAENRWAEDFMIDAPWDDIRKNVGLALISAVSQVAPLDRGVLAKLLANEVPEWPGEAPPELQPGERAVDLPTFAKPAAHRRAQLGWDQEATPDARVARRDHFSRPLYKGYTASFVDVLARVLPTMSAKWFWNVDYFRVWARIMTVEPLVATYGARRGYLGQLLDVWLGNDSPHPLVELGPPGKRLELRSGNNSSGHTNLDGWLISVAAMVESNVRETGAAWGASEVDRDMLLAEEWLRWLPLESSTIERGRALVTILRPLVTESPELTDHFINTMAHWIRQADFDVSRPVFRWLPAFLAIEDSLAEARREKTMRALVEAILDVRAYWKDFDFYLAHLLRLAKASPEAKAWLQSHPAAVEPLVAWLEKFPQPPAQQQQGGGGGRMLRFRPRNLALARRYRDPFDVNTMTSLWSGPQDMPAADKVLGFQALIAGEDAQELPGPEAGYDSDSENHAVDFHIQQVVDARDRRLQWQRAKVVNKLGNSISIRWPEGNAEWIKLRQYRIAPEGAFHKLTPPPLQNHYYDDYRY